MSHKHLLSLTQSPALPVESPVQENEKHAWQAMKTHWSKRLGDLGCDANRTGYRIEDTWIPGPI